MSDINLDSSFSAAGNVSIVRQISRWVHFSISLADLLKFFLLCKIYCCDFFCNIFEATKEWCRSKKSLKAWNNWHRWKHWAHSSFQTLLADVGTCVPSTTKAVNILPLLRSIPCLFGKLEGEYLSLILPSMLFLNELTQNTF